MTNSNLMIYNQRKLYILEIFIKIQFTIKQILLHFFGKIIEIILGCIQLHLVTKSYLAKKKIIFLQEKKLEKYIFAKELKKNYFFEKTPINKYFKCHTKKVASPL